MATFINKTVCSYQTHKLLTEGLKDNSIKDFVKKYKKLSSESIMLIFYNKNKALPICERCLEFCKSIGQLIVKDPKEAMR